MQMDRERGDAAYSRAARSGIAVLTLHSKTRGLEKRTENGKGEE